MESLKKLKLQDLKVGMHVKTEQLSDLYVGLYAEGIQFPTHPDGIHGYLTDAYEAKELIMSGKDLPQDLLDRLAYYKPIIDKQLKER